MKTCSKCNQSLDESQFVKSAAYKDGLYPSCKACRKSTKLAMLANNPMCSKCGVEPHLGYIGYCASCHRVSKGRSAIPSRIVDVSNTTMCCKCKVNPRSGSMNYCKECQKDYNRSWFEARGGHWKYLIDKGDKDKAMARHYVGQNVRRGNIVRKPCQVCGKEKVEGHHHLGYEPEHYLDVVWLCLQHHREAHQGIHKFTEAGELIK